MLKQSFENLFWQIQSFVQILSLIVQKNPSEWGFNVVLTQAAVQEHCHGKKKVAKL